MKLIRRFPGKRVVSSPIFAPAPIKSYPSLAQRFQVLEAAVAPAFERCDRIALDNQARFRSIRLLLVVFAGLTTVFGSLQTTLEDESWPGLVLLVVGAIAAALTGFEARVRPGSTYLVQRARAEELRSLYFRYLAGEGDDDPRWLERAVADIEHPRSAGS